jgi:hypothetical protein
MENTTTPKTLATTDGIKMTSSGLIPISTTDAVKIAHANDLRPFSFVMLASNVRKTATVTKHGLTAVSPRGYRKQVRVAR